MIELGQIVYSKQGRDRGRVYIVCDLIDDNFVKVTDGNKRPVGSPKRKNKKHLQPTNKIISDLAVRFKNGYKVTDEEIRRVIAEADVGKPGPEGGEAT